MVAPAGAPGSRLKETLFSGKSGSDTVTVKRILPNIITKMNLPVMGPDGQPMSYSLDHKEGGKRLREDQTLLNASVSDGDHLIVYPEIVAG